MTLFFWGKDNGVPYHHWGYGFDTVLRLVTQQAKDQFNLNPTTTFLQLRYKQGRVKTWIKNGQNYTETGHTYDQNYVYDSHDNTGQFYPGKYPDSRKTSSREYFFVFDFPSVDERNLWTSDDVVVQPGSFIVNLYDTNNQIIAPTIAFQIRNSLCYDYTSPYCNSGFNGTSAITIYQPGQQPPTIPNWSSPPAGSCQN